MPSPSAYLYDRVAGEITRRIENGTYRPADRLPSIDELAAEFGSSVITIRRALKDLVGRGLLISRQGQGNFVRDRRKIVRTVAPGSMLLHDLSADIRAAGLEPGLRVLSFVEQAPTTELARRLALRPDESVYRMDSLVLADNIPIAYDHCHIPASIAEAFGERLKQTFVIALLREAGREIRHMNLYIEVLAAGEPEHVHLDVPRNFPLLSIGYTPVDAAGRALVAGHFTSRGDRLAYNIHSGGDPAHTTP